MERHWHRPSARAAGLPARRAAATAARAAAAAALAVALWVVPAAADHESRSGSESIETLGHSPHSAQHSGVPRAQRETSSDLAFWGATAFHGNFDGFRVIDISDPRDPTLMVHERCGGDQGDIVVWDGILVRSWDSPAPAGSACGGQPVPVGFEGLHIFDVSEVASPQLIGAVPLACGSHTVTAAPDPRRGRLIVYSNSSIGACDWIDIVEVPLAEPAAAQAVGQATLAGGSLGPNRGCHDAAVILGSVNLLACAAGHAANVFSIGPPRGGSLSEPLLLHTIEETDGQGNQVGVGGRWHSAAFTWDGEVLVLGWEPGDGGRPRCREEDPDIAKSLFFYHAGSGARLGQWVLPRPQTAEENCTIHNFNVVPLRSGRHVVVSGNYQAGTWVTDFTDPARPVTLAWSDPEPLAPTAVGGAWSSYWYNGHVYESSITEGLHVFRVRDARLDAAVELGHLNPQTQQYSFPPVPAPLPAAARQLPTRVR